MTKESDSADGDDPMTDAESDRIGDGEQTADEDRQKQEGLKEQEEAARQRAEQGGYQ